MDEKLYNDIQKKWTAYRNESNGLETDELQREGWWEKLTSGQQEDYVDDHPNSKKAKNAKKKNGKEKKSGWQPSGKRSFNNTDAIKKQWSKRELETFEFHSTDPASGKKDDDFLQVKTSRGSLIKAYKKEDGKWKELKWER